MTELERLKAENEACNHSIDKNFFCGFCYEAKIDSLINELANAEAKNKKLIQALKKYADADYTRDYCSIDESIALQALEENDI